MLTRNRPHLACAFLVSCFLCASPPAHAATAKEDLEQTTQELEQARKHAADLAEQDKKLESELLALQEKLVKSAGEVQKAEAGMSDAEEKLRILGEQIKQKEELLKKRKQNLSALITAALTLSHTPPEAVVMMPGDSRQTMIAARALKMASESIRAETQSLGQQMVELQALKEKVSARRDELAARQAALDKERHEMMDEVAKRSALIAKLGLEQKEEAARLARLARKADDLKELVTGIEKEEAREAEEQKKREAAAKSRSAKENMRSFLNAKGHIRVPVSGELVQKFGAPQGRNSTSKGITLHTRRGAKVVAPFDGEIVFTGPFLNYGQMVILRHSDEFHTLLAGLSKIDAGVGQFMLEGEPIGAMGDNESPQEPKLYIELRKDNQPVDPAEWLGRLSKKN